MKVFHILVLALLGGLIFSCERHKFEETKKLNEEHPSKSVKVEGEGESAH